jgi:hypothetical protein
MYKVSAVSVARSMGWEKKTCGRKVAPTSAAPWAGITPSTVGVVRDGSVTLSVVVVELPAESVAVTCSA